MRLCLGLRITFFHAKSSGCSEQGGDARGPPGHGRTRKTKPASRVEHGELWKSTGATCGLAPCWHMSHVLKSQHMPRQVLLAACFGRKTLTSESSTKLHVKLKAPPSIKCLVPETFGFIEIHPNSWSSMSFPLATCTATPHRPWPG